MYNLFLDDERYPHKVTWVELPLVEWVIVRNYNEFVQQILTNGLPARITFDHDLAFEHMRDYFNVSKDEEKILDPLKLNYKKYTEKTGYDCAKWLVNYCIEHNLDIPEYFVHSMNVIGKRNIISYLESYKKSRLA
jgi:hypothetical protein